MASSSEPSIPGDDGLRPRPIGAAMRAAREECGVGLREMARRLHLSAHSNLSEYEAGKRMPPEDIVDGYEKVLDLEERSLLDLLDETLDAMAGPRLKGAPRSSAAKPGDARRHKKTRSIVIMSVGFVLTVAAGAMIWAASQPGPTHSEPPTSTVTFNDGSDPQVTGCRLDAVVQNEVDVYDPPMHLVGTLELRGSRHCGMSWGRFSPTAGLATTPPLTLSINVTRPADGRTAPFTIQFDGQSAYGDMLMSRLQCVYATAVLHRDGRTSPVFQTACVRSPQ